MDNKDWYERVLAYPCPWDGGPSVVVFTWMEPHGRFPQVVLKWFKTHAEAKQAIADYGKKATDDDPSAEAILFEAI